MKERYLKTISVIFITLSVALLLILSFNAWEEINFFQKLSNVREDATVLNAASQGSGGEITNRGGNKEEAIRLQTEEPQKAETAEAKDTINKDTSNNKESREETETEELKGDEGGEQADNPAAVTLVTLQELINNRGRYEVIDVREPEEFDLGKITGAVNIRLGDILNVKEVQDRLEATASGKALVFFCHDGERSRMAADSFLKNRNISSSIIEAAFTILRKDEELAGKIWTGSLRLMLPLDFWREVRYKRQKLSRIASRVVIDVRLDNSQLNIDLSGKTVIHAPVMVMATSEVDKIVGDIGPQTVAFICNTNASCFFSQIIAYRIKKNGGDYEGYYFSGTAEDRGRG